MGAYMKRQGFTLAEVLLCVGIIGIVSAMGAFATKHSIDQAYRGYWYNGYVNLSNAIADLEANNMFDSNTTNYIQDTSGFASNIKTTFGSGSSSGSSFTANNGISYTFSKESGGDTYYIEMKVPQPKTKINQNGNATAKLAYNHNTKILMPIAGGNINLQERIDLLPFYLDDGTAVYKKDASGNLIKKSIQYMTFKDAYCLSGQSTVTAKDAKGTAVTLVDCSNAGSNTTDGFLKVANPKKIR